MESENLEIKDLLDSISSIFTASESSVKVFVNDFQENITSFLENLLLKILLHIIVVTLSIVAVMTALYEIVAFCMQSYGLNTQYTFLVMVTISLIISSFILILFRSKTNKNIKNSIKANTGLWEEANKNIKSVGSKIESFLKSPLALFKDYQEQFSSFLVNLKANYKTLYRYKNTIIASCLFFCGIIFRKLFNKSSQSNLPKTNYSDSNNNSDYSEIRSAIKGLIISLLTEQVVKIIKDLNSQASTENPVYSTSKVKS